MAGSSGTKSRTAKPGQQTGLFPEDSKGAAKTYSLPPRFKALSVPAKNAFTLLDTESGREVEVSMGAFGEVQKVLGALFGGKLIDAVDSTVDLPEAEPAAAQSSVVIIPAPENRIFGGALKRYAQKWLKENGHSPDAAYEVEKKEVVAQEGDPKVEVAVSEKAESAVWSMTDIKGDEDTSSAPAPAAAPKKTSAAQAKPTPKAAATSTAKPVSNASYEWKDQDFELFSLKVKEVGGTQGYDVVAGKKTIGRVELGPKGKFQLTFPNGDYENSAHANMMAVTIKLNVVLAK